MYIRNSLKFLRLLKDTPSSEARLLQRHFSSVNSCDTNKSKTTEEVLTNLKSPTDQRNEGDFDSRANSSTWRRGMKSWEIHSYGGPSQIQFTDNARVPTIRHQNDVLIHVKAASINPIDVAMTKGYGSDFIQILRRVEKRKFPSIRENDIPFPITLGRDFSGIVAETGCGVTNFRVGDEVYGVLGFTEHGGHAEYTVASTDLIHLKPTFLSHLEAASLPYVGLTFWSALKISGNFLDLRNKRFLILGGSGGVGTFATQYLKSFGAKVVCTCSTSAMSMIEHLGADYVVDYTQSDYEDFLRTFAPYDCILNFSGPQNDATSLLRYLKPICGQYITLSPPLLSNFDHHGFFGGAVKNMAELFKENFHSVSRDGVVTKWAFFVPSSLGFRDINSQISQRKVRPVVEQDYPFSELPKAYEKVEAGHLRGKIVTAIS